MKTKLILVIIVLLFSHDLAFTQDWRYADLRVELQTPTPNSSISSPGIINFQFQIVNQGPDTIFTTDTLFYKPNHSYSFNATIRKKVVPRTIAPMDSIVISDTISVNSKAYKSSFELSFSQVPMVYGPDVGKLRLVNEFSEDRDDNYASVALFHTGNVDVNNISLSNTIKLFPNPNTGNHVLIDSEKPIYSVGIFNTYLQEVQFNLLDSLENKVNLELNHLSSGTYVVQIHTTSGIATKQLIIE